jgi:hypothetical protein
MQIERKERSYLIRHISHDARLGDGGVILYPCSHIALALRAALSQTLSRLLQPPHRRPRSGEPSCFVIEPFHPQIE